MLKWLSKYILQKWRKKMAVKIKTKYGLVDIS
ncbi:MAG: Asp23/Gls24 family envelope stress response protein, partial [Lactobacillus iners]|nr:Asp23/Gls24 family envelope stress response protein [Lactobacillus iners]